MGALTLYRPGKYRRPFLFVLSLKYSGKAFRKVVWKVDQQTWARLHEEAFRAMGGSVAYVVLDNLKQGVIKPDLYEPQLNPVYTAMLAHYDACRTGEESRPFPGRWRRNLFRLTAHQAPPAPSAPATKTESSPAPSPRRSASRWVHSD